MRKFRKKLIVQPIYSILVWGFLSLIIITFIVFSNFLWKFEGELFWLITFNVFFVVLACVCICKFLNILQVAVISETGIVIKNLFTNIINIEWGSIIDIKMEKLITYDTRGVISLEWFIIRTDNSQIAQRGGVNKKNNGPWQIIANKKNIVLIQSLLVEFCPNLLS